MRKLFETDQADWKEEIRFPVCCCVQSLPVVSRLIGLINNEIQKGCFVLDGPDCVLVLRAADEASAQLYVQRYAPTLLPLAQGLEPDPDQAAPCWGLLRRIMKMEQILDELEKKHEYHSKNPSHPGQVPGHPEIPDYQSKI